MTITKGSSKAAGWATRGSWILALALTAGSAAWAQQDQPPPPPPDTQQQQQQPDTQAPPPPAPADQPPPAPRNRRVLSTDRLPGSQAPAPNAQDPNAPPPPNGQGQQTPPPPQQYPQPGNRPYRNYRNQNPNYQGQYQNQDQDQDKVQRVPPARPAPDALILPKGTVLNIRTNEFLSSDKSKKGDHFTATLQQPLVVNGFVVARRGETVEGEVIGAQKAGRVKGTSQLALQITGVTLVDGQQVPIATELWQGSGGTSHGADAATIATTTGLGAAIGAAANWGTGAAVGAGAGLLTGIGAVLLTRGRPTIIPPEAEINFHTTDAITINTTANRQAYQLLRQEDFGNNGRGGRYAAGYRGGPPPYPPCGPYGPCYVGPPVYYSPYFYYGRPWGWRRW